jgi:hypothetical protein
MATYRILSTNGEQYTLIVVEFDGLAFEQNVMLRDDADLQAYADDYEAAYAELSEGAPPAHNTGLESGPST